MRCAIRNWKKFQHYSDRNPPWIKLHFSLLSSQDWVTLDDESRVLAIACMLVASKDDGMIDVSPGGLDYLKRVAYLNSPANIKPLLDSGFLEPDSECEQMLADARPETEERQRREETDAETKAEKRQIRASKPALLYRWDEFAALYPADKLVPDAKAKAWWRKHMTTDLLVNDLLAATRIWVESRKYQDGFGFGACRFLTEGVWKTLPPADRTAATPAPVAKPEPRYLDDGEKMRRRLAETGGYL